MPFNDDRRLELSTDFEPPPEDRFDIFAEELASRFKAAPKLSEAVAVQIAVGLVRESFGGQNGYQAEHRINGHATPHANGSVNGHASVTDAGQAALVRLVQYVSDAASPAIVLAAIARALDIDGQGKISMADLGARHGVTRQAFSKHVETVRRDLGLKNGCVGLRSDEHKATYKIVHDRRWAQIERDQDLLS